MIRDFKVTNPANESLLCPLMAPETSGFIIKSIDGLGPAKSTINIKGNSGASGSTFNSAKTASRNIVISLLFLESPTIEAARLRSYRYFPNEARIRLDFTTDAGVFHIYGYVESNDPSIFEEKEGTVISVICTDPYFYTEDGTQAGKIEQYAALFSFPFHSNLSGDRDPLDYHFLSEKTIKFGEQFFQTIDFEIPFEGTVNVGPTITLTAEGGVVTNPRIYFYNENDPTIVEALKFAFTTGLPSLADGDYLTIVCERGKKSVTRHVASNGSKLNYVSTVTPDSVWPVLHPGKNLFSYEADSGGAYIRFGYEYELKYKGI